MSHTSGEPTRQSAPLADFVINCMILPINRDDGDGNILHQLHEVLKSIGFLITWLPLKKKKFSFLATPFLAVILAAWIHQATKLGMTVNLLLTQWVLWLRCAHCRDIASLQETSKKKMVEKDSVMFPSAAIGGISAKYLAKSSELWRIDKSWYYPCSQYRESSKKNQAATQLFSLRVSHSLEHSTRQEGAQIFISFHFE